MLVAGLDAKLQMAPHAEHDLVTFHVWWWQGYCQCHLWVQWHCYVPSWTVLYHVAHVPALQIQEGIDISPIIDKNFLSVFNAFFGSQISPLYICRLLMNLIFPCVTLYYIVFLMLACPHCSHFNHPSYKRFPGVYIFMRHLVMEINLELATLHDVAWVTALER